METPLRIVLFSRVPSFPSPMLSGLHGNRPTCPTYSKKRENTEGFRIRLPDSAGKDSTFIRTLLTITRIRDCGQRFSRSQNLLSRFLFPGSLYCFFLSPFESLEMGKHRFSIPSAEL
ncbi:hypothetical protein CDAR_98971 [Caerostris darwini]|uniref:Uncharacterized protein n=1 Tax=Caerostris darwini TaxID=1538125 RepID=A0AAV4Q3Y2_9ARAC|nr:hypothetical protein CDAR_98971 [Caerostris darwini]